MAWRRSSCSAPSRSSAAIRDIHFLKRVYHKLLLYYAWWINRKDAEDNNVFEGGFLGLDNISVLDRSAPLPPGYSLKQADATGLMAQFALNMTAIALELAVDDPDFEDMAIQTYDQFLAIAGSIAGHGTFGVSLWDEDDGFFKDLIVEPDGTHCRLNVYSLVGLIPLLATEVVDQHLLANVPRFVEKLGLHEGGTFYGQHGDRQPDLGERPRRAAALHRRSCHAAAHPRPGPRRGAVPLALRDPQRQPHPRHQPRTGHGSRASASWSSSTCRASPTRRCSAATPTGAGRSGSRSTTR